MRRESRDPLPLSLCLSVSPSLCLSISVSLSVSPSRCLSISLSVSPSLSLSLLLSLSLHLSAPPSLWLCLLLPFCPSLSLPPRLCTHILKKDRVENTVGRRPLAPKRKALTRSSVGRRGDLDSSLQNCEKTSFFCLSHESTVLCCGSSG